MVAFGEYAIILCAYLVSRYKYPWLYNCIASMCVVNLCCYQCCYMPFSAKAPREYMFWSIML